MNIIFFAHPDFLKLQSQSKFTQMLMGGMNERGHRVQLWKPKPVAIKLPVPAAAKKWLGYVDQYIIFPRWIKKQLKSTPQNTLFVFTDNALGPWVGVLQNRLSVMHCHDFLAQHSAMGMHPENVTRFTGKVYQRYILKGLKKCRNFISVSKKTHDDLHAIPGLMPTISQVVYNGFNKPNNPISKNEARLNVSKQTGIDVANGFIMHIGGNAWYKNRCGVIKIYNAWRQLPGEKLPLLLIGAAPSSDLRQLFDQSPHKELIFFLNDMDDAFVQMAYCAATVLLFPSLEEGFGWPLAEAMANGCPVITTNKAPMNEVAADAALYIDRMPFNINLQGQWAQHSAEVMNDFINDNSSAIQKLIEKGFRNASRFNTNLAMDAIEAIYKSLMESSDVEQIIASKCHNVIVA